MSDDFDVVKKGEMHRPSYDKGYYQGYDDAIKLAEENLEIAARVMRACKGK
jgi:hypothetical protein